MEINIEGLPKEEAKEAVELARRIKALGFVRGYKAKTKEPCPVCGGVEEHVDEGQETERE
jgi:hypothetical protein